MKLSKSQSGFSVVEVLIVLVVVGVISFVGYTFLNGANASRQKGLEKSQANTQATEKSVPAAPAIEKTSDLDKASATLDKMDTTSDTSELDTELNNF